MLADIVKAIELLLNALRGELTPEKKRQRVAKKLLAIHQLLKKLIKNGWEIIGRLSLERIEDRKITVDMLMIQQDALSKLNAALLDETLNSFLGIHLPSIADLEVFIELKTGEISFYIAQLTSSWRSPEELASEWSDMSVDEMGPEELKAEVDSLGINENEYRRHRKAFFVVGQKKTLSNMSSADLLAYKPAYMRKYYAEHSLHARIRSSPKYVEAAQEQLQALQDVAEQLRSLLLKKFELEDVL